LEFEARDDGDSKGEKGAVGWPRTLAKAF